MDPWRTLPSHSRYLITLRMTGKEREKERWKTSLTAYLREVTGLICTTGRFFEPSYFEGYSITL